MRRNIVVALAASACLVPLAGAVAQSAPDLTAQSVELVEAVNDFGQPVTLAEGVLINDSGSGYADVAVTASAYDAGDALIAEGFGVLVDVCGAGLLPGAVIAPGQHQRFSAPLEFLIDDDDPASLIERVEVDVQAAPVEAAAAEPLAEGLTRVSDQEVLRAEWLDETTLRYAIGCPRDLFVDWDWRELNLTSGRDRAIAYPAAALVTDELRERLDLTDPALFANSRLSFAPSGERLVYQDGVNRFYTAAADGTVKRLLYTGLHNRVLQDIEWLDDGRFLATYYGAVGEPVLWFTADAEARPISPAFSANPPSLTAPGVTRDARRVIVGGAFETDEGNGPEGYYLNVVTNGFFELLFEAVLPPSNYPAPVPVVNPDDDLVTQVYVVQPEGDSAVLACFNRGEGIVHTLAPLPLALTDSDHAAMQLSPDETTLALTATGAAGGLWLIDLTALPPCAEG